MNVLSKSLIPALAVLLTLGTAAVPARAATPAPPSAAGATWSQLMRRKLGLDAEKVRLLAAQPALRVTVATRDAELLQAGENRTTTAAAVTAATTADQNARARHETAATAATAAAKAFLAAKKARPLSKTRVAAAQRTKTAANTTAQTRAAEAARAASALTAAKSAAAGAAARVVAATKAREAAGQAVTANEQRIAALPGLATTLTSRAVAVRAQVVTESRASFTTAQTTQVYGVTVNTVVSYSFQRMVDDAAKAGVPLSGGGFRTRQQQIALRTTNGCPDVWTAPASSCRVPTAIPGRSLHELGLAIDITSGKKTITDRKSKAFLWLAANAGRYGFVNLPSEPWHWSITGG